ncbi:hypothetical protein [Roseateles sp. L2-2]|uniref:hypothetical protein n=1 Tax=Roseateles TaxID=93681 RepID=UPI003D3654A9
MTARQFAIFEIYFHLGEAALSEVRRVAFGAYDWTQGNALEILCRFAASGLERDAILKEIREESPNFREEATIYAMGPLMAEKEYTPALEEIIVFLRDEAGFDWAYEEVMAQQVRAAAPKPPKQATQAPMASGPTAVSVGGRSKPWWKFW